MLNIDDRSQTEKLMAGVIAVSAAKKAAKKLQAETAAATAAATMKLAEDARRQQEREARYAERDARERQATANRNAFYDNLRAKLAEIDHENIPAIIEATKYIQSDEVEYSNLVLECGKMLEEIGADDDITNDFQRIVNATAKKLHEAADQAGRNAYYAAQEKKEKKIKLIVGGVVAAAIVILMIV